jgi:Domain of unknown function (DUF4253)
MPLHYAAMFAIAAALLACGQSPTLTTAEMELGRAAGIPESALAVIRAASKGPLEPVRVLDSLGNLGAIRGVGFALDQGRVKSTLALLQTQLGPDYFVVHTDQNFGYAPDSIGVIRTRDPLEVLRIRGTSGVNYDIGVDSVLALYRSWDAAYGLALQAAGPDVLQAGILRPPRDFLAFARAVYAACPDVVTQGTSTVEALADEMRSSRILFCWWD